MKSNKNPLPLGRGGVNCDYLDTVFNYSMVKRQLQNSDLEKTEHKIKNLEKKYKNLQDLIDAIQYMKQFKVENKKELLEDIVNNALKSIFVDEDYSLKLVIEPPNKTRKTTKYKLEFYQYGELIGDNTTLMETNGGGVLTVVAFVLKIIVGMVYNKQRLFLLDESLAQLSDEYTGYASMFIRELSEKYNLTIVLITQNLNIAEHSHMIYHLEGIPTPPTVTLNVKEVVENWNGYNPKEIFKVHVKNFQSIKATEFVFKGFTAIRAKSNTGKSALFRAIGSVLYNKYNPKIYPRKQKGKGETTEVHLQSEGLTNLDIKIVDKNEKVCYIFDGDKTLCGKKTITETLNEYLDEHNFSNISMDKYKSYKSNLRDQLESLAVDNQYNGLFLVNGSTQDLDKVFTILFDAEAITHSLKSIEEDKRDIEQTLIYQKRDYDRLKIEHENNLKKIQTLNYEMVDCLHKTLYYTIKQIQTNKKDISELSNKIDIYDSIIEITEMIGVLNEIDQNQKNDKTEETRISCKIKTLDNMILVAETINILEETENIDVKEKTLKTNIATFERLETVFELTDSFYTTLINIKKINKNIESTNNTLNTLPKKYHLSECNKCSGIGYNHTGE